MNSDGKTRVELEAIHTPEAIRRRLKEGVSHSYLRDFVFGAIDGSVTTFAVVAGVAGARLSPHVVIIMGVANLLGDGFSMAASNFLGTRAEIQQRDRARAMELSHIARIPEGEKEEIRQIFASKGFSGDGLEHVVETITADRDRWVETMMREELGLSVEIRSARRAALWTFAAFIFCGSVPLLPYFMQFLFHAAGSTSFNWSMILTGATFFGVGALKSRFVLQKWPISGLETLLIGEGAATLAYVAGVILDRMLGSG